MITSMKVRKEWPGGEPPVFAFRTVVAEDCCGNRAIPPHKANLFDMGQKYANLMSGEEALAKARAATAANAPAA